MAAGHEYGYDALMRPVQRRDSWDGTTPATTRNFTHNSRSGLVEDRISRGGSFIYSYDNIGNRKTAREPEDADFPQRRVAGRGGARQIVGGSHGDGLRAGHDPLHVPADLRFDGYAVRDRGEEQPRAGGDGFVGEAFRPDAGQDTRVQLCIQ